MKTKFTKFTKAVLFCFIIVLASCEKDLNESLDPNNKTAPFKSKIVGLDDITNIKTFISQNFNTINSKTARTSSGELTNAIFSEKSIIQTIDDKNNTNYSIRFVYDDTSENVFYNLIISISPSGEKSSHVLKYICNPSDFNNFMAHHFDFKYFVGVTELSSVNNISSLTNKSSKQQSGDDECPEILLPSNTSINTGTGGSGGENSTYSASNTTVLGYNVSAGTSGITSVTIGGTTYYAGGGTSSTSSGVSSGYYDYLYHFYRPSQATQKTTQTKIDCPQTTPIGYVPVNTNEATLTYLRTTLALSKSQFMWLRINPEVQNEIFNYLYSLNNTPEAKVFALTMINAARIEENIDDTKLDPCAKAVLDKLKNATNTDIAKMISRFGQLGSIFNINIIPGKVGDPNNFAETSKVNGLEFDINIILNKDYIDGTYYQSRPSDLSIATTITHEIIHAYLISATSEFNAGCGLTICNFPTIYDAYVADQASKNTKISQDAHEELIATKYLNTIAETVQEFHTGKPVAAGMATQVYTDLAMNGLWGTKYFNKKYPDNPNDSLYKERERIKKRVQAERSGVNFGEITIAGTPCNK